MGRSHKLGPRKIKLTLPEIEGEILITNTDKEPKLITDTGTILLPGEKLMFYNGPKWTASKRKPMGKSVKEWYDEEENDYHWMDIVCLVVVIGVVFGLGYWAGG